MKEIISNPVYQDEKFNTLKESYGFVKTADILDAFTDKGWNVASEDISKVRNLEKQGYQKHMIRLEHPDFSEIPGLEARNKSVPQLCLLNSHDGTTSLQMFLGLVRMACLNGIIAGTALSSMKLVHSKYIMKRVPDAIDFMSNAMPQMIEQIRLLNNKTFSDAALKEFLNTCVDARLQNVNKIVQVDYNSANRILRAEDVGTDAFTVMNRIQESILRGGIEYSYERNVKAESGVIVGTKLVHTKTRRLSGVTGQLRLNRLVYDKALELAA